MTDRSSGGRPVATVTLRAVVHLETEPGSYGADAAEPPYDYLVIREVYAESAEAHGDTRPLRLVRTDGFDDADPDGLLVDEVRIAVLALAPEPEQP